MPVVTSTEVDPSGAPQVNALVVVRLVASLDGFSPGYDVDEDETIVGAWPVRTDEYGAWSATFVPNSTLVPADTYYVAEVHPGRGKPSRIPFIVPDGDGPYQVEDILAIEPVDLIGGIDGGQSDSDFSVTMDGGTSGG